MSPERHVHVLPGKRPPLERRHSALIAIPSSWSQMHEILKKDFENNQEMLDFLENNRTFYMRFFEARYDIATQQGSEKFIKFRSRFDNPNSKFYKEERFTTGKPIILNINRRLFPNKSLVVR
ncbi:MAG: hypothetical protein M1365_05010 [Actinobacteria bacterium]|nr:hypothetical protein [Actinomycetota bacterium]